MKKRVFISLFLLIQTGSSALASPVIDVVEINTDTTPDSLTENMLRKWEHECLWSIVKQPENIGCGRGECYGVRVGVSFIVDEQGKPGNIVFSIYKCRYRPMMWNTKWKLKHSFRKLSFPQSAANKHLEFTYGFIWKC